MSSTVFGVPRSHWHATLQNFKWPSTAVQQAIHAWMESALNGEHRNLLFAGGAGTGKTHLAVALYRWAVLHWGTLQCSFVPVPEFFHTVKEGFGKAGSDDPLLDLQAAHKVVVLDDILGRDPTSWELDHIVFRLINVPYANNAAVVITTNYTLKQLGGVLKPHELSRVLQNVSLIEFTGVDQRWGR